MHKVIEPRGDYRVVAISDCHGGLHILKKLLKRLELKEKDYLVIIGDFIQKGPYNIEMLKFIKDLSKRPNTIILTGNHEFYVRWLLEADNLKYFNKHLSGLWHECILDEWIKSLGRTFEDEEAYELQEMIKENFADDLDFLKGLPVTLKLDQFIFVHGGVDDKNYREKDFTKFLKRDEFYLEGHSLDEYVVCGHWPVGNYKKESLDGDPILDHDKRILAIDGGQGVKSYGQMNALIIDKKDNQYIYDFIHEDDYPVIKVKRDYPGKTDPLVKLSWQSNEIEIIGGDEYYADCIKISSGETTRIPKMLIDTWDGKLVCKRNWINYYPSLKAGDEVKCVEVMDWLTMVKVGSDIGWVPSEYLEIV